MDAASGAPEPREARTIDLDFVIVGGGILGTAVAALASQSGYRVLVLRLGDGGIPRADTLRNQGWLQSGLLYSMRDFSDEAEYRALALRTFFGGREMLREYPGFANMFEDRATDAEREMVLLQSSGTSGQIHHEVDVLPGLHVDADVLAARIEVAKSGGVPVILAADLQNRA